MTGAAYEVVPCASADEAEAKGLIVVEWLLNGAHSTPVWGRYLDAAPVPASAADAVEGPAQVLPPPVAEPAPKRPRGRPRKTA